MCTCLEEVLDSLWVIAVALSADSLHFLHLTSLAGSLRRKNTTVSTINQGSNPPLARWMFKNKRIFPC